VGVLAHAGCGLADRQAERHAEPDALRRTEGLCLRLHGVRQRYGISHELQHRIEVAGAIARRAPGESLSSRDIEELITATSDTQGKVAFTQKLLEFEGRGLDRVEAAAKTLGYKN
jgi:hypothetical protein